MESSGQLYEGAACEKRKQWSEEFMNHVPVAYKSTGGYQELFVGFESGIWNLELMRLVCWLTCLLLKEERSMTLVWFFFAVDKLKAVAAR